jgi:nickel/cobalt transporter (NicO) family protein
MNRHLLLLLLLILMVRPAVAHNLPKSQYDRTVEVRIEPTGVNVRYQLVLSEDTMQFDGLKLLKEQEMKQIPATRDAFIKWYAEAKGNRIARSLFATLNDKDVPLRLIKVDVSGQDHNQRFEFRFRADWSPANAQSHQFRFADDTQYVGKDGLTATEDVDGVVSLTVGERGLNTFAEFDTLEPTRLNGKQRSELKPNEEPLRRQCEATFKLVPSEPVAKPAVIETNAEVTIQKEERSLAAQFQVHGLKALLESNLGIGVLLFLSTLFGMAHAFTPGHGKTMVAAYLIGERGTAWHAITLGLTATAAHTGSVILIAFGMYFYYGSNAPASTQAWLMLLGGLLIFLVGLWLFLQRLRGRADHFHLFADHDHNHNQKHDSQQAPNRRFGWLRVVLLGLGGGIIPCWDAVMMLLVAMAQGRIGLAIPLLFAFSIGLALVMIGLGLAVLYAHRKGGAKFGESKWFQYLPVLSALLLLVMGFWFLRGGFQMLGTTP